MAGFAYYVIHCKGEGEYDAVSGEDGRRRHFTRQTQEGEEKKDFHLRENCFKNRVKRAIKLHLFELYSLNAPPAASLLAGVKNISLKVGGGDNRTAIYIPLYVLGTKTGEEEKSAQRGESEGQV